MAVARTRTPEQRRGDFAETLVAERLESAGWRLLGRNVHVGRAELDIVALDPGPPERLVAVEVRWRSRRDWGMPEETFDRRKRSKVRAGLLELLARTALPDGRPLPRAPVAVDLVVVEPPLNGDAVRLRHHRDVG